MYPSPYPSTMPQLSIMQWSEFVTAIVVLILRGLILYLMLKNYFKKSNKEGGKYKIPSSAKIWFYVEFGVYTLIKLVLVGMLVYASNNFGRKIQMTEGIIAVLYMAVFIIIYVAFWQEKYFSKKNKEGGKYNIPVAARTWFIILASIDSFIMLVLFSLLMYAS